MRKKARTSCQDGPIFTNEGYGQLYTSRKMKFFNLKETVVKNLQNDNEKLRQKCEQLERRCAKYDSDHNALAQYSSQ